MKKIVDMLVAKDYHKRLYKMHTQVMEESKCMQYMNSFSMQLMFCKIYFLVEHCSFTCYFTHHIFWIGSPKRKACDNHSWLCHVQSCVVWSPFCLGLVVSWSVFWNQEQRLKNRSPLCVDLQALQFVFLISRLMFIHSILIFGSFN